MNSQRDYQISLPKETLAQMPKAAFTGEISVISSEEQCASVMADLMKEPIVGFDTETKPCFVKGKQNKVSLMQIATDSHAYLFQLKHLGIEPLRGLLESESVIKVGLSVKDDFHVLRRSAEIEPAGFVELQTLVKEFRIADMSLQRIYGILFGERISKSQRLSNWDVSRLSQGQRIYAATDAWACLRIYNLLKNGGFSPEECPYKVFPEEVAPAPTSDAKTPE